MFDLGWAEIMLVVAVALIVIGPKDLPQAVRTVTQLIRKMRGMAREFQSSLDDIAREAGVDEIKKDLTDFKADYDPRAALENIADAEGDLSGTFDDITDPTSGNRIGAPGTVGNPKEIETDERPDPPDLTPDEFGAIGDAAGIPADKPASDAAGAAEPKPASPSTSDPKRETGGPA